MTVLWANTRRGIRTSVCLLAILLCSIAAAAQVTVADYLHMNLVGNLGFGYSGTNGNGDQPSSHGQGLTGSADLRGDYFNPNFISFQFRPYYDRSQTNTDSQSVTRGTGFGGSASFFGGSHFPGSISFGKDFSTNNEFRIAGVPTISGDSSGQSFGVTWSALVPDYPTLTATYSSGSSDASYLETARSHSASKSLTLTSGYTLAGFNLQGNFSRTSSDFSTPAYLTLEPFSSSGTGTAYGLSVQHRLPWSGNFGLAWSHSNFSNAQTSDWSSTSYTAGTSISPWRRVTIFQNATYTTNLAAAFAQSLVNNGSVANLLSDSHSEGVYYSAGASFSVGHGISLSGHLNHRVQWLSGRRYEDTQYGGNATLNMNSRLFGLLYFGFGLMDNASKFGNEGLGFNANLGLSRKFAGWETAADFNYSQNVQTMVAIATTSYYGYGASLKRKLNNSTRWSGAFRGSHSGLVLQAGSGNRAESLSSGLSLGRYSFSGSYSQSSGTAVFTYSGELTATPLGSLITDNFLLFNARSWSVSASTVLFRRMNLMAGYAKFKSSSIRSTEGLSNNGDRYNLRGEYRLRKFSIIGGFNRSMQDVSTIAGGPRLVNSYYGSFSRWFDVF